MRPRTGSLGFSSVLLFIAVVLAAGTASAGRLHPDVDAQLATLPPGGQLSVIVELSDQTDPHVSAAPHRNRRARLRAVVDALRNKAGRTQAPIRALLAQERAAGRALRHRPLWIFNGVTVTAEAAVIRALAARADVREVRLDRAIPLPTPTPTSAQPSSLISEWNIDQIRAPEVWAIDPSYTGVGTVVASFDTGVDGTHPDLAPSYRGNDAISWFDPYGEHASPFDADGHGTHTTGTMVGGAAGGTNIGVAPGAKWIGAKGWNDAGVATVSAFHEIFEWLLAPGGDPANAPDVVNMSWSFAEFGCLTDFLSDIQALRAAGIFPVVAAGNSGPFPGTIPSPGAYLESVTVGATDIFDDVPYFSSRGPGPCGGGEVKPNLSAPGDSITSTFPGGFYFAFSGTSMAAPHVAGAVAVLKSINPDLTVDQLETVLIQGVVDLGSPGPDFDYGAGRLDLFNSAQIALGGGGPDQPHVTIVATDATATEAGLTGGLLTVTRTGPTDADLTVHYTVSGSAVAGSDYVTLPGSVTILAGSETATIPVAALDDSTAELDETVVVSLTFDASYFIGNPGKATVNIVSDELLSDLSVSALTLPTGGAAGDPITLNDTTANTGAGPAEPSVTRFYFSSDTVFDPADTLLGTRAVPALAPGTSSSGTTTVTIPGATTPGTYYVVAVADGPGTVLESNEENNQLIRSIQVGPDLVVSAFSAPPTAGAGIAFTVNDTTRNAGAGAVAASTTRFYLSANPTWEATDVAVGSRAVPALAAGASHPGTATLTIPGGTAGGVYYLIARADGDAVIAEASEFNNVATAIVRVGADLTVSAFTVPAAGGAGLAISVSDTTTNLGGGAAPASTTRFYLSVDYWWSAEDTLLGSRAVPALAAGAASTVSTTLTIPAGTGAGLRYVVARADADLGVPEADENNNVIARPITLGADLTFQDMTVPAVAAAGQTITVSDTVKNLGGGTADPSTTRYYLSVDGVLDAGDLALGSRAVPALAPNATHTGSAALTLPAGLASGSYLLFAKADGDGVVAEVSEANNVGIRGIQVGADLVVSALTVPTTGGAGAALTIQDTTRNQAGAASPASTTRFYLSLDTVWDVADVLLGSRAVPVLAGLAQSSGSVTVAIPGGTATGSYSIIARADADAVVGETQEANNTAFRVIQIGPDLTMSALTGPANGGPGLAITLNDTTRNLGGGAAGGSTTRFYLSADGVLDGADVALGARAVPALAGGAPHSGATVVTIPAGTATGTWFLLARADADGVVGETTESNNLGSTTIRIGGDLVVSVFTVPAVAAAGATISVTDTTTNQGLGPVGGSLTRFFLSTDANLDAADTALSERAVAALGAGAGQTASTPVTIPAGVAGGTWYLIALADAGGGVAETAENNNWLARAIQIGADLAISALSVPPTGGAGAVLSVTETTRNQGGAPAGTSVTAFWLSTNWILEAGDVFLGSRAVPALAAGGTHAATTPLTLPADTTPGQYYLLIRTDADGTVAETNEANNITTAVFQVGPDLVLSAFSVPPTGGAGLALTVTDTTRNQGGGASGASTTSFWLSTNPAWDAADLFLGSRPVPALAPGQTSATPTSVTIPAGTTSGLYYILARADTDSAVIETQEGNNVSFAAVTVGADLRIAWVTGPGAAAVGGTFNVTDATQNAGGGSVESTTTAFYLSTNTTWDAADLLLGSRIVPALAGGATSTIATSLTIPAGTAAGAYYLLARADNAGVVGEANEANNVGSTNLVVGPDMTVFVSATPTTVASGGTFTVNDITRNIGAGSASGSTTRFYLSTNALWDAGDQAIGSRVIPALAPGTNSSASTSVTIPAGTTPGTWYLIGRADADNDVPEGLEINNTYWAAIQVTP
jgi:subtilase family serine protease/subtilisin family serine protease